MTDDTQLNVKIPSDLVRHLKLTSAHTGTSVRDIVAAAVGAELGRLAATDEVLRRLLEA